MTLIPVYPIVVYDYSQQSFDSLSAEEQVVAAQQKRDDLQSKIQAINERMVKMSSEVLEYNKSLLDDMQEIEKEIEELEAEKRQRIMDEHSSNRTSVDDDLDEAFSQFYQNFSEREQQRHREYNAQFEDSHRRKRSKEAAKLFRKLAMKTHPDRTSDPEMHKLFIAAKQYYLYDDVEGLQAIFEAVSGNRMSSLLNRLFKKLQELLSEIKYLEQTLKALRSSEEFEVLQRFEARKDAVLSATYAQNQMRLVMLRQHRDSLLIGLGKQRKTNTNSFTTFILG